MLIHDTAAEDKNNKLMSSEGMEATEQEIIESFDDDDEGAVRDPVDDADIYD
jgi:translation initiation factor eIF-2B subunit gamma